MQFKEGSELVWEQKKSDNSLFAAVFVQLEQFATQIEGMLALRQTMLENIMWFDSKQEAIDYFEPGKVEGRWYATQAEIDTIIGELQAKIASYEGQA